MERWGGDFPHLLMTQNLKVMTTSHVSAGTPTGVSDHFLSYFVEARESRYGRSG